MRIFKKDKIYKDNDGLLKASHMPKDFKGVYGDSVLAYLNWLDPLFEKAQQISDFQFIQTLLSVRGYQSPGWDAYENTINAFDKVMDLSRKVEGGLALNLYLWLYGHILEASEPYETIANLMNICKGETFRVSNFPKVQQGNFSRNQYPKEKIYYLENLAQEIGMPDVVKPIKEIFDKDLRNAIFHSDYSVYEGEVRIYQPDKIYSKEEVHNLINKTFAYYEVLKNLSKNYTASYNEPKIIEVSTGFSNDPESKAMVIVRKNYGAVGLRDAWTDEQLQAGKIPFYLGRHYSYESKYLDKREALLPADKIKFWNGILSKLPRFLARRLVMVINKLFLT